MECDVGWIIEYMANHHDGDLSRGWGRPRSNRLVCQKVEFISFLIESKRFFSTVIKISTCRDLSSDQGVENRVCNFP